MSGATMTERQKKWFATVQANLEKASGKSREDWIAIMKTCPETTVRGRTAWLKANHGLGVNHASYVLSLTETRDLGWDEPERLRAELWRDPLSLSILKAVEAVARGTDGVLIGQRKGYTPFSRAVQFAAMRPLKGGKALLGLKLEPDDSPRLRANTRKESWSERLTAVVELSAPGDVDAELAELFRQAADRG